VVLGGEETRLDRRIARALEGALRHLAANAGDHGVEPPAGASGGKSRSARSIAARPGRG
jgi:chemotaxis protein histidine kinase CheA